MKRNDSGEISTLLIYAASITCQGPGDAAMRNMNIATTFLLKKKKKKVTLQRKLTVFLSSSEALVKPGSVAQVL